MNGILNKNRIWIPGEKQEELRKNFFRYTIIQKHKKTSSFISKLSKDGRLVIPKQLAGGFIDGKVFIRLEKIKNSHRTGVFFDGNKFHILSVIPERTMSGFEVLAYEKQDGFFIWFFASKGRPNEIFIKKYIGTDFARFLGYYRSEGGKPRLSKRRGREFSFTNGSLILIGDFLKIIKSFAEIKIIKASIRYPEGKRNRGIERNFLLKAGLLDDNIKEGSGKRLSRIVFRVYVTNSAFSEIISNSEIELRKIISENPLKNNNIMIEYLRGVLMGDGSFYSWRDKKGSLHSRIQIFEPDKKAMEDIANFMEEMGIRGRMCRSNRSDMFIFTSFLNWEKLLRLYSINLFPNRREKIAKSIIMHKRFRTMKHFQKLPKTFERKYLFEKMGVSKTYANTWLRDMEREGLVSYADKKRKTLVLTKEGIKNSEVLKKV